MTVTCTTYYRQTDLNTTSGALTHRYYVRDYLGSTRAVIDEDGNVLQSTAYYPSGMPLTPNSLTPQTIKLHTGKDFFDLQGIEVANPQSGIFIKVQGEKASKELIK